MKKILLGAAAVGVLAVAWWFGQPKKVAVPLPTTAPAVEVAARPEPPTPAEPPKPLVEGLDLSRAFSPVAEDETSPLILASFQTPADTPTPPPVSRFQPLLVGLDALIFGGLRMSWLSVPLPTAELLDIMPREVK